MLLIVSHHFVVSSGIFEQTYKDPVSGLSIFYRIMGAWGKTGINIFVLITGFFMCCSVITFRKFLKLLCEIEFYNIVLYVIFAIAGYQTVSVISIIKTILPVTQVDTNFTGCYLLFYLLIPFLNILIKNMNEKQHIAILGILLFVYSVIGFFPNIVTMNYVSWFTVVYLVGTYIRLYEHKIFKDKKKIGILAVASICISVLSIVLCGWLNKITGIRMGYYFLSDSNKVFAVTTAVFVFLIFKNLKMPYVKWINEISAATFGVFLIHTNSDAMRAFLWKNLFKCTTMYNTKLFPIYAVGTVLIVYIVCTCIDILRKRTIEKKFFKFYDLKGHIALDKRFTKFDKWLSEHIIEKGS